MTEKHKTILLVEDEILIAMDEARMLEDHGYSVVMAHSGAEAVDVAAGNPALDLVLMDIDLGDGMDGTAAAEYILRERDVPVLFLSSHTEPGIVEKTEGITSYGYVVKNTGDTVLLASIKMAFKLHHAHFRINSQKQDLQVANEEFEAVNEELVRSEEELRASEERYRGLYKSMNDGMCLHGVVAGVDGAAEDYRILDVNPMFETITGISRDAAVGKLASELYGTGEPPYLDIYAGVASTGIPFSFETYFPPMDRHFRISVFSPAKGQFATVFQDITERRRSDAALRESEERYRMIFAHSPAGMVRFDRDGVVTDCNDEFVKIFGSSREALVGLDMPGKLGDERFIAAVRDSLAGRPGRYEGNFKSVITEKETPVRGIFSGIGDMDGGIAGGIGVFEDMTAHWRVKEEERRNTERLESLVKIMQRRYKSIQELLDFALDEAIKNTGSRIGYICFYNEEDGEFILNTWSKEVMAECSVVEPQTVYRLDKTGYWGEAVRQRKPMVNNDFTAPHELKKGVPDGHVPLEKFMTVPVFSGERIVAVVGVANKREDYDVNDLYHLILMMDSVWKIVEHRQAEDEARVSRERLARAEIVSRSGNWEFDLNTDMVHASEGARRIYGLEVTEWPISEVQKIPLPGYRALLDDALGALVRGERPYDVEFRIRRPDTGGIVDIHSVAEFDRERRIVFGIIQDITERKLIETALRESEERWHFALEGAGEGVWDWNAATGMVFFSTRWKLMLGYGEGDIGDTLAEWDSMIHPDDRARAYGELDRHFRGETPVYMSEHRLRCKDGSYRWILDRGKVIERTSGGKPLRVIGTHADITDRKRMETELERVAEEKQSMLKELQHRIKNSFATVASLVGLEAGKAGNPDTREALGLIRGRIETLSNLYTLLYETGDSREISLGYYLNRVASSLEKSQLGGDGMVTMETRLEDITMDVKRASSLGLVLNELLMNAVKYAFPGGRPGKISVALKNEGDIIVVEVRDNGAGLPADFDIGKAKGLGLVLVVMLTRQLGGEVTHESGASGTMFRVAVPVK